MSVFISLHVATMGPSAAYLAAQLRAAGVDVWVCTEALEAGDAFRDEIVKGLKTCRVFLALINAEWARSGECKDEYSLAKRLNLTSHERGITKAPQLRQPVILPISFPNLVWDEHPHIELLAASTNFLVARKPTLGAGADESILGAIFRGLHAAGLSLKVPEGTLTSPAPQPMLSASAATQPVTAALPPSDPATLAQALLNAVEYQRQTLTTLLLSINRTAAASGDGSGAVAHLSEAAAVYPEERREKYTPKMLRSRYFGTQVWSLNSVIDGADSFEFEIEHGKSTGVEMEISGTIVWRRIYCKNNGGAQFERSYRSIAEVMEKDISAVENIKGVFNMQMGHLKLKGSPGKKGGDFVLSHDFSFLLNHDGTMILGTYNYKSGEGTMRARGF